MTPRDKFIACLATSLFLAFLGYVELKIGEQFCAYAFIWFSGLFLVIGLFLAIAHNERGKK